MKKTRVVDNDDNKIRRNVLKRDLPNNIGALEEYAEDLQGKYTVKSPVKRSADDMKTRSSQKKIKPNM